MTKTTRRKNRSVRWLSVIIALAVLLGVIQMAGRIDTLIDMRGQVKDCQARLVQAQALYDEKMTTIELLDNPSYLERVARENLGMVKAGETIVSVVRADEAAGSNTNTNTHSNTNTETYIHTNSYTGYDTEDDSGTYADTDTYTGDYDEADADYFDDDSDYDYEYDYEYDDEDYDFYSEEEAD
ncbi:MAG: septum formation initiator family protein [Firmicutes bacterium]|nr:septum formation initiator family protein [Bacillota bacterium]